MSTLASPTTTGAAARHLANVSRASCVADDARPVLADLQPAAARRVPRALFGPLLVSTSGLPAGRRLRWFVPGVLVMIALFGSGVTGSNSAVRDGRPDRTSARWSLRSRDRRCSSAGRSRRWCPCSSRPVSSCRHHPVRFRGESARDAGRAAAAWRSSGSGSARSATRSPSASRSKDWMFWAVQQGIDLPDC